MRPPADHGETPVSAGEPATDRFQVRDFADIDRLSRHLVTHWDIPRVGICTDGFPLLVAQRAQDRFERLAKACNCLFGSIAGISAMVCGTIVVWASSSGWRGMIWTVLAAVWFAALGMFLEPLWTRMRLLLVLRELRRRRNTQMDLPASRPVGHDWLESSHHISPGPPNAAAPVARVSHSRKAGTDPLPKLQLRNRADIKRVCLRLATHRTLPRIEIQLDAINEVDAQRAQYRYDRLSKESTYLLAGVMTALALLGGLLHVFWVLIPSAPPEVRLDEWFDVLEWSDVQPVLIVALCAGLTGWIAEFAMRRLRLLLVLRSLWRHADPG